VPIVKPEQKHKYNTKTVHTQNEITKQNKNNMAAVGKSNINEVPLQKPKSLKTEKFIQKFHRLTQNLF